MRGYHLKEEVLQEINKDQEEKAKKVLKRSRLSVVEAEKKVKNAEKYLKEQEERHKELEGKTVEELCEMDDYGSFGGTAVTLQIRGL